MCVYVSVLEAHGAVSGLLWGESPAYVCVCASVKSMHVYVCVCIEALCVVKELLLLGDDGVSMSHVSLGFGIYGKMAWSEHVSCLYA